MKIIFHKYSGAGNDFILFSAEENPDLKINESFVKKVCERRTNIGADGVLFVEKADGYDFEVTYFNSDGSTGSLCGNGARCAIHFAVKNQIAKSNDVVFTSGGQTYSGELLDDEIVRFKLNHPENLKLDFELELKAGKVNASFIDTGSPHAVLFAEDLQKIGVEQSLSSEEFPVVPLGKEIRHHDYFSPSGTNVNFVEIADDHLVIRTYERGVEDETLACGTGSVASAMITFLKHGIKPPVKLLTKSGKFLTVDFDYAEKEFSNVNLIGPAEEIFTGYFYLN